MSKGNVIPGKGTNMRKGTEVGNYELCVLLGQKVRKI